MRTLFIIVLAFTTLVSAPLFAQDEPKQDRKDVVDTGQGLKYTKPSGWVLANKKKGAVSGLYVAGDEKTQIEFRYAKISGDRVKGYFATFHTQLGKAKLKRVKEGEPKEYGELNGTLTEYAAGEGDKKKALFVYEFTDDEGAWLVVGMFDGRARDKHLGAFEAILKSVVFE